MNLFRFPSLFYMTIFLKYNSNKYTKFYFINTFFTYCLTTTTKNCHIKINTIHVYRAGEPESESEPEPVGAGCFWFLGAGAAWKKNRSRSLSRSRLEKNSRAGVGAAKKLAGSSALLKDKKEIVLLLLFFM